jgi:hypothetical protein
MGLGLKVPKREIFDRSDFSDFYTIKSSWVGDLLVKILTIILIFERAKPHLVSDARAELTLKELMRMLSIRIRAPDAYAQYAHQFLTRMLSMVCRDIYTEWPLEK